MFFMLHFVTLICWYEKCEGWQRIIPNTFKNVLISNFSKFCNTGKLIKTSLLMLRIVKRKLPENLQGCGLVLEFLKKHMRSRTPPADIFIPPIPKTVRNYFKVIKRPMWLNKIESNLYLGKYKNVTIAFNFDEFIKLR